MNIDPKERANQRWKKRGKCNENARRKFKEVKLHSQSRRERRLEGCKRPSLRS